MKNRVQLVIPAAGNGQRFKNAGFNTIKPLIPVFEIPMINWVIANFSSDLLSRIIIISKFEDELHELKNNWFKKNPIDIEFCLLPDQTQGPADTVSRVKDIIDLKAPMVVANSDQFVDSELTEFLNRTIQGPEDGMLLSMTAHSTKWSYIGRRRDGQINKVVEKMEISNEATVGIYGWKQAIHFFYSYEKMCNNNDRTNGEFYVAPTYNYLISEGFSVGSINIGRIEESVYGLGTPEDLKTFLENDEMARISKTIYRFTC